MDLMGQFKRFLSKHWLVGVLLLALVIRLVELNQSYWLDEAIGVLEAKNSTYLQIITEFLTVDNHPPLYYLLLKFWGSIFGLSEVSTRLMSVLLGLVAIVYSTKILGFLGYRKNLRIIVGVLLATSPLFIYYTQEVRMYAMAACFAAMSIYHFLKADKSKKFMEYALFSFGISALVFTDYVPVLLLPIFWIYGLIKRKNKKWWIRLFLSYLPLVLLGILWLPIFIKQTQHGAWLVDLQPAWLKVAGGASIKHIALVWMKFVLGRITFANKLLYYSLVVVSSIPFLVAFYLGRKKIRRDVIVYMWLFVPLILGFLASSFFPLFIYFRFVFLIPAFYLCLAGGITVVRGHARTYLIGSLILVNIFGWAIYVLTPDLHRENWREATNFVENRLTTDEVVLFEYPFVFAPYRYYSTKNDQAFASLDSINSNKELSIKRFNNATDGKTGVYYFEYLHDITDPEGVLVSELSKTYKKYEIFDFVGIGQVTYWVKN